MNYIKNKLFLVYPFMEGEVNLIFVKNNTTWRPENFRELFEDFDLNCNHVFFNLEENKLSWTPLFVEFLSLNLIKINPAIERFSVRSMVRAAKKAQEFKARVAWDEVETALLQKFIYHGEFKLSGSDYLGKDHIEWLKPMIFLL